MKITFDSSALENALNSIGGIKSNLGEIRNARVIKNPIELRIQQDGEIVLSAEELLKNLQNKAGLLAIGDTQITIHIYDPFVDGERLMEVPAPNPKFHFTECDKIEEMRSKGRFNRYVPSNRKDGYFLVRPYDQISKQRGEEMNAVLSPCKFCLKALDYEGWAKAKNAREKAVIFEAFDIEKFYEDFVSIFRCLPLYTPETFPDGNYTEDWAKISHETRRKANWVCSCCRVDCSKNTGLLHAHHKDGNRGNNRPSNLEVLCVGCHKARPFHERMHIGAGVKNNLEQLRLDQKIKRLCENCRL